MKPKKVIAWIMSVLLLFSLIDAHAATSLEKENAYNAAVVQLETYIESLNHNSTKLDGILSAFNELRGYSMSLHFSYYISALTKIDNDEYDLELDNLLSMLDVNEGFRNYLADMRNDSSIGTVDELIAYAHARELEYKGNNKQAQENYKSCMTFYDASQRYYDLVNSADRQAYDNALALMNAGDYAGAYFAFKEIERYSDCADRLAAIEKQLEYKPASVSDNLQPVKNLKVVDSKTTEIRISWSKAKHAKAYDVYFKESGSNDWIYLGNISENEMTIGSLVEGNAYDFKVVSTIGRINAEEAVLLNQKTVVVTTTPEPTATPTPTPKPTPAPKPEPTTPASTISPNTKAWDIVVFGNYEQDGDTTNGMESIEWIVLAVKNNTALMISKYALDSIQYDQTAESQTWENCSLRKWLNNDFLNVAFSQSERKTIIQTLVDNKKMTAKDPHIGTQWIPSDANGGNNTKDYVYILSGDELETYLDSEKSRQCKATKHAENQGALLSVVNNNVWWWIRSPKTVFGAHLVNSMGTYDLYKQNMTLGFTVRPALWVKLQ